MIDRAWTAFGIALTGTIATLFLCFLVATPICTLGIPQTPPITTGGIVTLAETDLLVSVSPQGQWYPGNSPASELENLLASGRYRRIVIQADRHARYGALLPVFRAARDHHVPVVLATGTVSVLEQIARQRTP